MGLFEDSYDTDTLRSFTPEERSALRTLHTQLEECEKEIGCLLAGQLGLDSDDPRVAEEVESAIEEWDESQHEAETTQTALTPLQQLLSRHAEVAQRIMDVC